ncbi:PaaI family thioesterase [Rubricoccus marinus]|uniref:Acyl-coenzyme A thioesterase THEM4 n=1 Tax=Rubricoccus marinus TaxID=716817 RepID=A0A259U0C0_9BACT|nr:PaaI family thioesterase [Rubricoccus marinus]OZC03287.1 hypothetical protein BSZ36_10030 [Rubricoccus marinus]
MAAPTDPEFLNALGRMADMGAKGLKLPPPVFHEMKAEPLDFQRGDANGLGASMKVRFPVLEQWQNPMGHMQGGAIAMAMDNVIGPLSYLAAPPSATTQMNLTYLAPITPEAEHIEIEARVTMLAGRSVVIDAELTLPDGTIAALARATSVIVRPKK